MDIALLRRLASSPSLKNAVSDNEERAVAPGRVDMPFVYNQTAIEWPEDNSDPPAPRADQFVYISPPEFGGAHQPVRSPIRRA